MQSGARPAVVRIYDKIETKRHFYEYEETIGYVSTIIIIEGNSKIIDAETQIIKENFQGNGEIGRLLRFTNSYAYTGDRHRLTIRRRYNSAYKHKSNKNRDEYRSIFYNHN